MSVIVPGLLFRWGGGARVGIGGRDVGCGECECECDESTLVFCLGLAMRWQGAGTICAR